MWRIDLQAMRFRKLKLLASLLLTFGLAQGATATVDFPAPPRSQVEWVSSNMVFNNRTMAVRTFESRLSAERVLEFYRRTWERGIDERPGYQETDAMDPWQIISRIDDDYLLTVQVTSKGTGSTGLLSASPLDQVFQEQGQLGHGFPMMSGSQVLNDIKTPDIGKTGRTLLFSNSFSINGNANYYRDWYKGRGWRLDMDHASKPGQQHVLAFTRGREKVNIVINSGQGGSLIVANSSD